MTDRLPKTTIFVVPDTASPDVLDLLPASPSPTPFQHRVQTLGLSQALEEKILYQNNRTTLGHFSKGKSSTLSRDDERELATEVLLLRHRFSEKLLHTRQFRQAAISIIQNIYLFKNRKLFFSHDAPGTQTERQDALQLFTTPRKTIGLPLSYTLQHAIIGRVWNRILQRMDEQLWADPAFIDLHETVERLNTVRNIYMMLTLGLVKRLVVSVNDVYKASLSKEDAVQIGSIGVARAAYRYHQSCGVRFSTYASRWVFKEIQRQALEGRLIRVSSHTVEQYAKECKSDPHYSDKLYHQRLRTATVHDSYLPDTMPHPLAALRSVPGEIGHSLESKQLRQLLLTTVKKVLAPVDQDIIQRRFGLPPYDDTPQNIIAIAKQYQVTRSSIYQREKKALERLRKHLCVDLA